MNNQESQNRVEFQKELEETVLLKNIQKNKLLQAPSGYYEGLNSRILERIEEGHNRASSAPSFAVPVFARWALGAASLFLLLFCWFDFRNEVWYETSSPSKPLQAEIVKPLDSLIMESTEMQTISEHILAEELLKIPHEPQTDSSSFHQELTEYLLMHADHELLIESL